MPVYTVQAPDGRSFDLEGDSPPTEQELEEVFASLPKPQKASKETPQTGVLPGEELSAVQQTALGLAALPAGIAYAAAPKELREQMTAPIEATAFGALQAAGELPGGLTQVGATGALASLPGVPIVNAISRALGGPTTANLVQQATEPIQDLTPKILGAFGVETATPEGPQFKAPGFAAAGEIAANLAPLPAPGAKLPEVAKGVAKAVKGDVAENAPRLIRSATKISNPKNADKFEKAVKTRFPDIYYANPEAHTTASSPYEGFVAAAEAKLDEAGQKLDDAMAAVGQANDEGGKLAQRLNLAADRVQARGGEAADIAFLRNRANEISSINTARGLQDAVTHAGRKVNWNTPRTSAEKIADEIISIDGGKQLNKLFENAKGPEAATIRKEWSDYKTIVDESNNRLNKLINQVPQDQRPAVMQALTSVKGLAGMFALLQGHGAGALGLGGAAFDAFAKKASRELKDSNSIVTKLYNDLSVNPPTRPAPKTAVPPYIQGFVSPEEARNIEIARQLSGQAQAPAPISSIPLEQGLVGQFVPERPNVIPSFSAPTTTRAIPVTLPVDSPLQTPVASQADLLAQQIVAQIQGTRSPAPPVGAALPLEAGTVRPTAIATPPPTTFSPTPGTTIPIETILEQRRQIEALSNALRQIQAEAAQRASMSEQIAQQLSQGSRVPRIFLPTPP